LNITILFFTGVVPEVQCAVKRKEKKAQREKDKPNSTTDVSPEIVKIEPTEMKVSPIVLIPSDVE
jgi:ecdysone receptor